MQSISVGQTIRTTDAWLTVYPDDGGGYDTSIIRLPDDEPQSTMYFELVVVNDQGVASAPAGVTVERYYNTDDGPGGPMDKSGEAGETPPIITQPETM